MSDYFLGVDGGQSGTSAVIGDETGHVAGWATGGPCNHAAGAEAIAKFTRVISACVRGALAQAGLAPDRHFRAACLGMSGGPDDKADLLARIVTAERLLVTHDAEIALAGALNGAPGAIVIAGTGSIAFGRNAGGQIARAGGWGYIFGDEGGAFGIVREALRAILREYEGWGPRTALMPALLETAGAANANELLHLWYTPEWPRSRIAALARLVSDIAGQGDPIATAILQSAAKDLALLAGSVRAQLWPEAEAVRISWTGGVFGSDVVRERFRELVELSGAHPSAPEHGPAIGALVMAWRLAGLVVVPEPVGV